jgi:hypothetical protein
VNIRKTFTKIKYSQIINTFDKIWRTNEIIYSTQAISDLRNKLRDLDASSVTQEQVNIVVNEFGNIHIDSAKETFGTITKSNNRNQVQSNHQYI